MEPEPWKHSGHGTKHVGPGKRYCPECDETIITNPRLAIRTGTHVVNGWSITDWEFDQVKKMRAERDADIARARGRYQEWLDDFLAGTTGRRRSGVDGGTGNA